MRREPTPLLWLGLTLAAAACGRSRYAAVGPDAGSRDAAAFGIDAARRIDGGWDAGRAPPVDGGRDSGRVVSVDGGRDASIDAFVSPDVAVDGGRDAYDPADVGNDAGACTVRCTYDYVRRINTCGAPISYWLLSPGDPTVLRVDLAGFTSLEATVTVCDPVGPVFQIADSPTSRISRGDRGSSSNDAHLILAGTDLTLEASELGPSSPLASAPAYVASAGCSTFTVRVTDQEVLAEGPGGFSVNSPFALRLDPPSDLEGTPDRVWFLGINRVVDTSSRELGTGLATVDFCLR